MIVININQSLITFQHGTAVNQTCVRMVQNVLSMTVALNASVRPDTKVLTAMVSK